MACLVCVHNLTVAASMSGRLVLLMILILAVHGVFIVEQPTGSEQVLPFNRRFSWFANKICYVPCQHYTRPHQQVLACRAHLHPGGPRWMGHKAFGGSGIMGLFAWIWGRGSYGSYSRLECGRGLQYDWVTVHASLDKNGLWGLSGGICWAQCSGGAD